MTQLTLEWPPFSPAFGRADFLVSNCNAAALARVESWPDGPSRALVLYGPGGSGKSHLAHLWRERTGAMLIPGDALTSHDPSTLAALPAIAIDDAERADEPALLHLFNCCREAGAGLLIVARQAPGSWPMSLADLASRLRATDAIGIGPPDDALLAAMLVKHFADRQRWVDPEVIAYLVPRMERSFAAAAVLAARLDGLASSAKRRIGLGLARQALAQFE
jgi:chromosomal replication initiation ATPase DnaA